MKEFLKKLPWIDKETREVVLPFAIILIPVVTGIAKETYSELPVVWQVYLCLLWLEVLAIATFLICTAVQYLKRVIAFKHPPEHHKGIFECRCMFGGCGNHRARYSSYD